MATPITRLPEEKRCSDCHTWSADLSFGICDKCRDEKYKPHAAWCDKHGPKLGRCFGCSMEPR